MFAEKLVLHSYRRCPFAIRVRMALEEKNLTYRVIEEDLSNPSADLLRYNPRGTVPVLLHNGTVIPESAIITQYIDEVFPEHPLAPIGALARARMRLWTRWCDEEFKVDLDAFKYEWNELNEEARGGLKSRLAGHLEKLESALERSPFLEGIELTLSDIHVFPFYRQLTRARADLKAHFAPESRRSIDEWLERITTRPSFDRVMAKN